MLLSPFLSFFLCLVISLLHFPSLFLSSILIPSLSLSLFLSPFNPILHLSTQSSWCRSDTHLCFLNVFFFCPKSLPSPPSLQLCQCSVKSTSVPTPFLSPSISLYSSLPFSNSLADHCQPGHGGLLPHIPFPVTHTHSHTHSHTHTHPHTHFSHTPTH